MSLHRRIEVISKLWVVLAVIALARICSVTTFAQSTKARSAASMVSISTTSDRIGNELVFESEAITIRHITLQPDAAGYHYRHPGGSIILLQKYSLKMPIPLGEVLEGELKVGDVIAVAPGDYLLENPTTQPLDFLSIEKKQR